MIGEVNFDLARMKRAVAGPHRVMPSGLTCEQFIQWMLDDAKTIAARKKSGFGEG